MIFKKLLLKLYRFFVSLKLAVIVLGSWAFLTSLGTFVEARFDQEIANHLVYHSFWMNLCIFFLSLNLLFVMIDRFPWKKKHIPFLLAHIGILIVILGFVFTRFLGIEGSLRLKEGESTSEVSLYDMELKVYSSMDGENFRLLYNEPVNMLKIKPSKKRPFQVDLGEDQIFIEEYLPFARGSKRWEKRKKGMPALQFFLKGQRASVIEWLYLDKKKTSSKKLGLATITLTRDLNYEAKKRELVLFKEKDKLFYSLEGSLKKEIKQGDRFKTGWMDLTFQLLQFYPQADRVFDFEEREKPSEATLKALKIRYKEKSLWLGQNSYIRFYKKDQVLALAFLNRSLKLDFDLKLMDFRKKNYQGSSKAQSYESDVEYDGKKYTISMNEPLKYKGFTFYQSSFEEGEEGKEPIVSIFSVNHDPGRILKYLGSVIVVLGIALLFLRKSLKRRGLL